MKRLCLFLLVAGLVLAGAPGLASIAFQEQEDDVRGAFLTTRPKSTEKAPANRPAKAVRRRPKAATPVKPSDGVDSKTPGTSEVTKPKPRTQRIGIGLTLFMRNADGLSVRVDPAREFRQGDRVRLLLESNIDGYLYVFNTTDDGPSVLIYPDADLDEGGNYIQAHVPVEIPSSVATEERLKWFRFDAEPGVERLYLVFSRTPLADIPLEDELLSFCRAKSGNCPIRPNADLWAQVQKDSGLQVKRDKTQSFGAVQTTNEHDATSRGIGLNKTDPEPSLVMMTASSEKDTLVTTLELIHK